MEARKNSTHFTNSEHIARIGEVMFLKVIKEILEDHHFITFDSFEHMFECGYLRDVRNDPYYKKYDIDFVVEDREVEKYFGKYIECKCDLFATFSKDIFLEEFSNCVAYENGKDRGMFNTNIQSEKPGIMQVCKASSLSYFEYPDTLHIINFSELSAFYVTNRHLFATHGLAHLVRSTTPNNVKANRTLGYLFPVDTLKEFVKIESYPEYKLAHLKDAIEKFSNVETRQKYMESLEYVVKENKYLELNRRSGTQFAKKRRKEKFKPHLCELRQDAELATEIYFENLYDHEKYETKGVESTGRVFSLLKGVRVNFHRKLTLDVLEEMPERKPEQKSMSSDR